MLISPTTRAVAAFLAATALLSGCTTATEAPEAPAGAGSEEQSDPGAEEAGSQPDDGDGGQGLPLDAVASDLPSDVDLALLEDSLVVAALRWVFDALSADEPPSEEAIEQVFTAEVLADAPAPQLREVFDQLGSDYRITTVEQVDARRFAGQIADDEGQRWQLLVAVDERDPPRMEVLFFGAPMDDPASFASWDEVADALAGVADDVSWLAAETTEGSCDPVAATTPDTRHEVASVGKLYVLGAVADAVADGQVSWDDEVEVTDDLRSLPTGRLQDEPAGTTVTVAEAAELMIAISDNTATDLLIDLVGRDAVEAALGGLGHQDPSASQPFVTTREVFQLSWQVDDEQRSRYVDGDVGERRAVLDELADLPLDLPIDDLPSGPVDNDAIGWFASPAEVCTALVALRERAAADPDLAPVTHALGQNPIVRLGERWSTFAAKGGSMPGVLAFAWDLEHDDGRSYAFVVTFQDPAALDQTAVIPLVEGALELLADTAG